MVITGCTVEVIDILKQNPDGTYVNERIYRDRTSGAILTGVTSDQIFTGSTRDFERLCMVDDVAMDGSNLVYFTRHVDIEGTIIIEYDISGNTYTPTGTVTTCEEAGNSITSEVVITYDESTTTGSTVAGLYSVSFSNEGAAIATVEGITVNINKSMVFTAPPGGRLPIISYDGTGTSLFITTVSY